LEFLGVLKFITKYFLLYVEDSLSLTKDFMTEKKIV
jgi:hypothetical protein